MYRLPTVVASFGGLKVHHLSIGHGDAEVCHDGNRRLRRLLRPYTKVLSYPHNLVPHIDTKL